jgi:hypothetical protein
MGLKKKKTRQPHFKSYIHSGNFLFLMKISDENMLDKCDMKV